MRLKTRITPLKKEFVPVREAHTDSSCTTSSALTLGQCEGSFGVKTSVEKKNAQGENDTPVSHK